MGRMLSRDPVTKTTKVFHRDSRGEEFHVEQKQDVTDIIAKNRHLHNTFRSAKEKHGEWGDKVAEIPAVIWGDLLRRGIANDEKKLRKWLDERDNLPFRCRPGGLSRRTR